MFVGQKTWEHKPMLDLLAKQVGQAFGRSDAVIVFDPPSFPKQGKMSVGDARQWCGRLGHLPCMRMRAMSLR